MPEVSVYVMDVPPYSLVGTDRHGIVGDVVFEAMRRANLQPKVIEVPNARALHDVPHLDNTLIVPLARLQEREPSFTWIARVVTVERAFFAPGKKVISFAAAKSRFAKIGVERGSAAYAILMEKGFSEDQLVDVALDAMAAKMMRAGRIDAWFGVVGGTVDADLTVSAMPEAVTEQYVACSRRCDAGLVKRLARAVREMEEDGTVRKIAKAYEGGEVAASP